MRSSVLHCCSGSASAFQPSVLCRRRTSSAGVIIDVTRPFSVATFFHWALPSVVLMFSKVVFRSSAHCVASAMPKTRP